MAPRPELQTILEGITENVYFQPPTNLEMQYPCIVYSRDQTWSAHADNRRYAALKRYQVTVVDRNPDSELPDMVEALPYSVFDRQFTAGDLHHSVFTLFF